MKITITKDIAGMLEGEHREVSEYIARRAIEEGWAIEYKRSEEAVKALGKSKASNGGKSKKK